MWEEKYRQYNILYERNKNKFRPETFKIYMDAPCGRIVSHAVLKDLGLNSEYKRITIYKPTFREEILSFC